MGCDIHTFAEQKINDEWQSIDTWVYEDEENYVSHDDRLYSGRNYYLFGILAGVRVSDYAYFPVKGFPEDVSDEVKDNYDIWGSDAHTPSYLSLKELDVILDDSKEEEMENFYKQVNTYLSKKFKQAPSIIKEDKSEKDFRNYMLANRCEVAGKFPSMLRTGIKLEDVRIVFWFDN